MQHIANNSEPKIDNLNYSNDFNDFVGCWYIKNY